MIFAADVLLVLPAIAGIITHIDVRSGNSPWRVFLLGLNALRRFAVIPLLAAANHDPRAFANPDDFDIARTPNRHLGFGLGMHFCLGAQLARMETRVGLKNLVERNPNLRLAVAPSELEIVSMAGWHRHARLPVVLT